ncbi:hypothetical protein WOC18_07435 [Vibrio parahaemolyticus]
MYPKYPVDQSTALEGKHESSLEDAFVEFKYTGIETRRISLYIAVP